MGRTNAMLPKSNLSVADVELAREALRDGKLSMLVMTYNHIVGRIQEERDLSKDIQGTYSKLEDMLTEIEFIIGGKK